MKWASLEVVEEIPGLTYRQLDYWATSGLLELDDRNPGSGVPRWIPEAEVAVLRLAVPLARDGLTPRRAFEVARRILADGRATLGGLHVTTGGGR